MQIIPASELIINERGAVYHLNLRPEELASTVITVGDPQRVAEVSKYFDEIEFRTEHREFITHTGFIGKKRISVLSSGIGPDNIDIVMNELDALVNVDLKARTILPKHSSLNILRLGTSGSLQADVPVNSLVAGTHGLGIDNLLHFYRMSNNDEEKALIQAFIAHTQLQHPFSMPYMTTASASLLKHFTKGYHHGITVTCPGFYGPQGRMIRLPLSRPDLVQLFSSFQYGSYRITNFEMETSAIYGLGKLLGHNHLSLNVIVANRIKKEFSSDSKMAIENLIRTTLEILVNI